MVKVKPAPMLKLLAVPGATPVPTVKDPPDPLKETLLLSRTGLLVPRDKQDENGASIRMRIAVGL
jgi:hypothetical protein